MRKVCVLSVARSDYTILKPVLSAISKNLKLELNLVVAGSHLSPEFGLTIDEIKDDGWRIHDRIEHLISSDNPVGLAKSIGLGILGFADLYARENFDLIFLMGDRFEMLAAAVAAQPFSTPIIHLHGGETSEGSIDENFRHSITKMSHLHFVSTETHRDRVLQLGENPEKVIVCGAPALDNLAQFSAYNLSVLGDLIDVELKTKPYLVTVHPETVVPSDNLLNLDILLQVLGNLECPIIFTAANSDTMGRAMNDKIMASSRKYDHFFFRPNLGADLYFQVMANCRAMIGNSSSGIIEAASFKIPVINLGDRQKGRTQSDNVINAKFDVQSIVDSLNLLEQQEFKTNLRKVKNLYFNGGASEIIVERLENEIFEAKDLKKHFFTYSIHRG